jgi:hypothetical protein
VFSADDLKALANLHPSTINAILIFAFGFVVALVRSLVDGARRSIPKLLLACIFGGLGAVVADQVFADSQYHIFYVGVAAVIAENFVLGVFNMSAKFRDDPIVFIKEMWRFTPWGNKGNPHE